MPVALSIAFDRSPAVYAPGDTIVVTITADPADRATSVDENHTLTAHVDGIGDVTGELTIRRAGPAAPVTLTDDSGRVYTLLNDNGTVAVFSATA